MIYALIAGAALINLVAAIVLAAAFSLHHDDDEIETARWGYLIFAILFLASLSLNLAAVLK